MNIKRICVAIIFVLLCTMLLVGCQSEPEAIPAESPTPTAPAEVDDVFSVSTVDELLSAIGPDMSIMLKAGEYDLSAATGYGSEKNDYYYWNECYDGWELVIRDVENLRIYSEEDSQPRIVTRPRYANVLRFEGCDSVSLEGLVIGHTEEQGVCSGGVLFYDSCNDMSAKACQLYGCGTIGITAFNSKAVYASDCAIYDCNQNAVFASACYDVRVMDSKIHNNGIEWSQGLFYAETCNGFSVVNCEIYENFATSFLASRHSKQLNVLGCIVRDNSFTDTLFLTDGYSPTVDKCSFDANGDIIAFEGLAPVDMQGNELSEEQIATMSHEPVAFDGIKEAATVALDEGVNAEGLREVSVSTVDEFLAAIGSDTVIKLEAGTYDFTQATDYGAYGSDSYYWVDVYDGPGLVINGVKNLSIVGEGEVIISAIPRYADAISFINCEGICLSGFTAGHTEEPGECAGGVLSFENCRDIAMEQCRLYGCGILGIHAYCCSDIFVSDTEIYDCSQGAIALYTVMGANFENMNVHDCAKPEISLHDCSDIKYEGEKLSPGDHAFNPDGKIYHYGQFSLENNQAVHN